MGRKTKTAKEIRIEVAEHFGLGSEAAKGLGTDELERIAMKLSGKMTNRREALRWERRALGLIERLSKAEYQDLKHRNGWVA